MDFWMLYWIVMLPTIGGFLGGMAWAAVVASTIASIFAFCAANERTTEEKDKPYWLRLRTMFLMRVAIPAFFVGTLAVFIPNDRQLAYIIGGYFVTNIEGVAELPDNTVRAMNEYLKRYYDSQIEK